MTLENAHFLQFLSTTSRASLESAPEMDACNLKCERDFWGEVPEELSVFVLQKVAAVGKVVMPLIIWNIRAGRRWAAKLIQYSTRAISCFNVPVSIRSRICMGAKRPAKLPPCIVAEESEIQIYQFFIAKIRSIAQTYHFLFDCYIRGTWYRPIMGKYRISRGKFYLKSRKRKWAHRYSFSWQEVTSRNWRVGQKRSSRAPKNLLKVELFNIFADDEKWIFSDATHDINLFPEKWIHSERAIWDCSRRRLRDDFMSQFSGTPLWPFWS